MTRTAPARPELGTFTRLANAEPDFRFSPPDGVRPTSVWHVAQPGSKICVWIIDKVGAVGAVDVGVVGLLLPHAPAAIASRSGPRVRANDVAVIRLFTRCLRFVCVSTRHPCVHPLSLGLRGRCRKGAVENQRKKGAGVVRTLTCRVKTTDSRKSSPTGPREKKTPRFKSAGVLKLRRCTVEGRFEPAIKRFQQAETVAPRCSPWHRSGQRDS